jgi:probable phosphoglycerate mutase
MSDGGRADTCLYLVRHGRVHNPREIAYGHLPRYGLDAHGRVQAHAAGRWLASRDISAIFTSPLLRARQTAAIIRAVVGEVPLHRAHNLRESELARHWQGVPWREIELEHPELYALFMTTPSKVTIGETLMAMADRLRRLCLRVARRYPGCGAVLVSHRDPILALRLTLTSGDLDALASTLCQPGSVTELRLEGGALRFVGYTEPEMQEGSRT